MYRQATRQLRRFHNLKLNSFHRRCFSTQQTFGFIGLGQMGSRMADNLITKSGAQLVVYDAVPAALSDIQAKGARVANSPKELAQQCSVVVTMLASEAQVRNVYTNESDGLLPGVSPGTLLIDCSTTNYTASRDITQLFSEVSPDVTVMDAPVSGGITAAAAASLTFMVGGSVDGFSRAESVLSHMGARVFHCGETAGSGQIAKICNNLILGISMTAVSEGMNLGIKLGMDPEKLAEIVNVSSGRCWSSDTYNPVPGIMPNVPSSKNYEGGFVIDLMRKDLNLALDAAKSCGASTPLGAETKQLYDMLSVRGHGGKDFGFMYQFIKGEDGDSSGQFGA